MISLEKWMILTPLQKFASECRGFGQINCWQRLWTVAQSVINHPIWSHWFPQPFKPLKRAFPCHIINIFNFSTYTLKDLNVLWKLSVTILHYFYSCGPTIILFLLPNFQFIHKSPFHVYCNCYGHRDNSNCF